MPTVPVLVDGLAGAFGFERSKAKSLSRYMREADLLTSGARGVNAPPATARDAVRVLLAMMLDTSLALVSDDVKLFGSLKPVDGEAFSLAFAPSNLEDAMVTIVERFMTRSVDDAKTFNASVRVVPYLITASVSISYLWDAGPNGDGDEYGMIERAKAVEFMHPDIHEISEAPLPQSYMDATARFPRKFWQAPELRSHELAFIADLLTDKISF
ncbi:hypothetical protein [Sphingomonas aquatilis]|nr:hypothetical protein [Sphingomonas aquatilis]